METITNDPGTPEQLPADAPVYIIDSETNETVATAYWLNLPIPPPTALQVDIFFGTERIHSVYEVTNVNITDKEVYVTLTKLYQNDEQIYPPVIPPYEEIIPPSDAETPTSEV